MYLWSTIKQYSVYIITTGKTWQTNGQAALYKYESTNQTPSNSWNSVRSENVITISPNINICDMPIQTVWFLPPNIYSLKPKLITDVLWHNQRICLFDSSSAPVVATLPLWSSIENVSVDGLMAKRWRSGIISRITNLDIPNCSGYRVWNV